MQNRLAWVMGTLAACAGLAAVGVGWTGYKNTPPRPGVPQPEVSNAPTGGQDADPMAPRLFDQSGSIRVHVAGAVRKPGVYAVPNWARVIDAMRKAGGAADNAELDAINLADHLKDGEQVRIPTRGRPEPLQTHRPTPEPPHVASTTGGHGRGRYPFAGGAGTPVTSASSTGSAAPPAHTSGPKALPETVLNLNTATRDQLLVLPGVGPATADRIVAFREEHGPYVQPEDLMNVKGIGDKRFEKIRPYVTAP